MNLNYLTQIAAIIDRNDLNEIEKALSSISRHQDSIQYLYRNFIIEGQIEQLEFVANYFKYSFFEFDDLIKVASTSNQPSCIEHLLSNYQHLSDNVLEDIHEAFLWAISMNARDSVVYYVEKKHIDLTDKNNSAILVSVCEGHDELTEYFLSMNAVYDLNQILELAHISKEKKEYFKTLEERKNLYHALDNDINYKEGVEHSIKPKSKM